MHAMNASSCGNSELNAKVISLAEYRDRRSAHPDDGNPPPGPGALGAWPVILERSLDAAASATDPAAQYWRSRSLMSAAIA
jgi:hypothetical protein